MPSFFLFLFSCFIFFLSSFLPFQFYFHLSFIKLSFICPLYFNFFIYFHLIIYCHWNTYVSLIQFQYYPISLSPFLHHFTNSSTSTALLPLFQSLPPPKCQAITIPLFLSHSIASLYTSLFALTTVLRLSLPPLLSLHTPFKMPPPHLNAYLTLTLRQLPDTLNLNFISTYHISWLARKRKKRSVPAIFF